MSENIGEYEHWKLGRTEGESERLLSLVLSGAKSATTSLYESYYESGEALPEPGDISVITHWNGNPACMIKTTCVDILPFSDVTEEMSALEGEGDSLSDWRKIHSDFFASPYEGQNQIEPSTLVVFERFELIESYG